MEMKSGLQLNICASLDLVLTIGSCFLRRWISAICLGVIAEDLFCDEAQCERGRSAGGREDSSAGEEGWALRRG